MHCATKFRYFHLDHWYTSKLFWIDRKGKRSFGVIRQRMCKRLAYTCAAKASRIRRRYLGQRRLPDSLFSFGMMHRTKCGCVVFRLAISLFNDSCVHTQWLCTSHKGEVVKGLAKCGSKSQPLLKAAWNWTQIALLSVIRFSKCCHETESTLCNERRKGPQFWWLNKIDVWINTSWTCLMYTRSFYFWLEYLSTFCSWHKGSISPHSSNDPHGRKCKERINSCRG